MLALIKLQNGNENTVNLPETKATFSFSMGRTSAAFKPSLRKDPAKNEGKKEKSNIQLKDIPPFDLVYFIYQINRK